jgi:hypothetical protein
MVDAMTVRWCLMLAVLILPGPTLAQSPSPAAAPNTTEATPAVAPQADRLLKDMGSYLGSAREFTFHADINFDHVLPSGQKLQFSAAQDVALQRPGRLRVDWGGDLGDRVFWYDGKSATIYDPSTPFYASEAVPADIDGMLDTVLTKLGFSPPLVDFLHSDAYRSVRQNVQYGFDLGETDVNGKNCRSLAFVEKDIDWQIWIENGPQLTPCKLVITYKTERAQPQFTAVFTDWDFSPRIADAVFVPELPPGTEKIPFATVAANK